MTDKPKPIMVCVSSGKGGVGKTTITVNLAVAWAGAGHRVLIIDGDLGLANVDLLMGIHAKTTIHDSLESADSLESCLVHVNGHLSILPSASGVPEMVSLDSEDRTALSRMIRAVASPYELIVIDTAAGIGDSVIWFNQMADANVLVVTPDPTAVTDVYALMKVLSRRYGRNRLRVVVNQAKAITEGRHVFDHLQRVAGQFLRVHLTHLGTLTQDSVVARAVREQAPFVSRWPTTSASAAMIAMADDLHRELTDGDDYS